MKREWLAVMRDAAVPRRHRLRVQERLLVLEYATANGVRPASRRFGFTSRTIRRCRVRWRGDGVRGLIPRYPARRRRRIPESLIDLIRQARVDFSYGSTRTQLWLWRLHRLRVSQTTIQRVVRELGLPRVKSVRKRRPRQLKLLLVHEGAAGAHGRRHSPIRRLTCSGGRGSSAARQRVDYQERRFSKVIVRRF